MPKMKTTAEERASLRTLFARSGYYAMPGHTERILDDLDTLLAENAKLRAVAEAAKAAVDMVDEEEPRDALRRALYALGEP